MKKNVLSFFLLMMVLCLFSFNSTASESSEVIAIIDDTLYISSEVAEALRYNYSVALNAPGMESNIRLDAKDPKLVCTGDSLEAGKYKLKIAVTGDFDRDGLVTACDARGALRVSARLDNATDIQIKCCDLDGDNNLSASEARSILRISAKLEEKFSEVRYFAERADTCGFEITLTEKPEESLFDENVVFWFYAGNQESGYTVIGFYSLNSELPLNDYLAERGLSQGDVRLADETGDGYLS